MVLTDQGRQLARRLLNDVYQAEEQAILDTLQNFSPEFVEALEYFSQRLNAGFEELVLSKTKQTEEPEPQPPDASGQTG